MTDVPPQDPFGQQGGTPPPPPPPPSHIPPQQAAPQPGAYYANQQGYSTSGSKNDPFAITSLVTGIVGVPLICCWPIGLIVAIVATVFGSLSLGKIKKSNGALGGRGMALAGLILGIVTIAIIVVMVIYLIIAGEFEFETYNTNN